ncbi:MAG: response regulator [Phycisphaeraceae bacterium]
MSEQGAPIRVMLIDDDEDSYLIVRHLLAQVEGQRYQLDWVASYDAGLAALEQPAHDLYLVDYRLDRRTGLDLLRAAKQRGFERPIVLLTGLGDRAVDLEAMEAGAADYLPKDELNSALLDRSIRYALEHQRLLNARDRLARKLRRLVGELERAEERERRRIALLLHEELQQLLVAAKMQLDSLKTQWREEPPAEVNTIFELLDKVLATCRSLTPTLSPPILHSGGLLIACDWLADWMEQQYGLKVELDLDGRAEPEDEQVRTFLFQAVRELLFNVVRHAGTSHARLTARRVRNSAEQIRIEVEDRGAGFDPEAVLQDDQPYSHFGLFALRQRLELMHGNLEIHSEPGHGTCIVVRVPPQTQA